MILVILIFSFLHPPSFVILANVWILSNWPVDRDARVREDDKEETEESVKSWN